jgi:hypothetical protein
LLPEKASVASAHAARLEAERVALDRSRKAPRVSALDELVVA